MSGAGKVGPGALPFTSIPRAKTGKPDEFLDRTFYLRIEVAKWDQKSLKIGDYLRNLCRAFPPNNSEPHFP